MHICSSTVECSSIQCSIHGHFPSPPSSLIHEECVQVHVWPCVMFGLGESGLISLSITALPFCMQMKSMATGSTGHAGDPTMAACYPLCRGECCVWYVHVSLH